MCVPPKALGYCDPGLNWCHFRTYKVLMDLFLKRYMQCRCEHIPLMYNRVLLRTCTCMHMCLIAVIDKI